MAQLETQKDEVKKGADEFYDARQYWWWAEKKRSPRINYLRKAVWSKASKGSAYLPGIHADLEIARWYTKAFKEAPPAEPVILTRARSHAAVLDNMPIFITDQSRIMGYTGSAPHLLAWIPTASFMLNEDTLNDRTSLVPDEDREELREMVNFWKGRTLLDRCRQYQTRKETVLPAMADFIQPGRDLFAFDYIVPQPDWMYQGFDAIIKTVDGKLAEAEKRYARLPRRRSRSLTSQRLTPGRQ
jgi:hypothetical protein